MNDYAVEDEDCDDESVRCWDCGESPCQCCEECGYKKTDRMHLEYCPEALHE